MESSVPGEGILYSPLPKALGFICIEAGYARVDGTVISSTSQTAPQANRRLQA